MPRTPIHEGSSLDKDEVPSSEEYGTLDTEDHDWLLAHMAKSSGGIDELDEEIWVSTAGETPYETPLSSQPSSRRCSDVVLSQETEHITFPQFKGKKRLAAEGDPERALQKSTRLVDSVSVSHYEAFASRKSSSTGSSTAYNTPSRTPDACSVADTAQTSFESKVGSHGEAGASTGKTEFDVEAYLNKNVKSRTPFRQYLSIVDNLMLTFEALLPTNAKDFSFRVCYEVTRVALHTGIPEKDLFQELKNRGIAKIDAYGDFRSTLANYVHIRSKNSSSKQQIKPNLPERCSEEAWAKSKVFSEHVDLSAELTINKVKGDRLFNLKLKPFKLSRSNRTTRKYGSDRLLSVDIPHIEPHELPEVLKLYSDQVIQFVIKWLLTSKHSLLDRNWAVWFVKPIERSKSSQSSEKEGSLKFGSRLYFVALSGNLHLVPGPSTSSRRQLESVAQFLDWALILDANKAQPIPKLFSRLQLVLSATLNTDEFSQKQVLRRDNAYSDAPGEWKLDVARSNEKKKNLCKQQPSRSGSIMNDGCARISRKAAQYIVELLGLDYVPCAFQGRIAGAKGMWMISAREESLNGFNFGVWNNSDRKTDPKVWIELTDEQVKFETLRPGQTNDPNPDPSRTSFEVLDYVKPLSMSYLNFQVLSVLLANGVPLEVFEKLLAEDLTDKAEKMKNAMRDPPSLAAFLLRQCPVRSQRVESNGIEMQGGLPFDLVERILYLLSAGFSPMESRLLRELCLKQINIRNQRVIDKMSIGVGRSTRAFILPDPMDVLKEGECFLYFSSTFEDSKTGEKVISLHDRDVLVARSPVLERSDVQKVRAVFKPELEPYKDVVIFSCRGEVSLAHLLSGGDFDGDKVWICWEPEIVSKFRNFRSAVVPANTIDLGLKKITKSLADLSSYPNEDPADNKSAISTFLHEGMTLNMRPSLLPTVNAYYDKYVYHNRHDAKASQLSALCAALLDASKAGLDFTRANWSDFQNLNGFRRDLSRPAYKTQEEHRLATSTHNIDRLVYGARNLVTDLKLKFETEFKPEDISTTDRDLTSMINAEDKVCKWEIGLKAVLDQLTQDMKGLYEDWKGKTAPSPNKQWSEQDFRMHCGQLRQKFLRIEPLANQSVTARRWRSEREAKCELSTQGSWVLLKASALFRLTYSGHCAWWVCGQELCRIKAMRSGESVTVIKRIFELSAVDARLVERIKLKERLLETKDGDFEDAGVVDSDDEFGAIDWATSEEAFGA